MLQNKYFKILNFSTKTGKINCVSNAIYLKNVNIKE